ncbi:MAG: mechanosensitive ion channel [Rhodobacterales bacterium]|nr:mechanosensitive ion channel [Rhodobacterales bacterium]
MISRWFPLLSMFFLVCLAGPAVAQDAPAADTPALEDEPSAAIVLGEETLLGQYSPAVQTAATTWYEAWQQTPRLVSLKAPSDTGSLQVLLEERLKLLGEKTFSNREWKTYWATQSKSSWVLSAALTASNAPADLIASVDAWTALADKKVVNQDGYFEAIELERDALEDRLEDALEAVEAAAVEAEAVEESVTIQDPNPYEARRMRLEEFENDITAQNTKRTVISSEVTFVQRLLATEEILADALQRDLALAKIELSIAESLAGSPGAWGKMWTAIEAETAIKLEKITEERDYGQTRRRSREVELGLSESQIKFRDSRIAELKADYQNEGSVGSLVQATWSTILNWLRTDLWRIVLGLFAVYIGIRMALRVVQRSTTYILEKTDDDPDNDDDGDQRRKTLADVFQSVARLTIYIVAGLIALDQIGVNTGPLLGSVAILGLAVSFGAQNLVRDVVNGFFILLENQFAVGDVVTINGKTGTVDRITIRSTWIRAYNGDLHAMPNGGIGTVTNSTRGWSRTVADIGVGYGADIDDVEKVLNQVGAEMYAEQAWMSQLEEAPSFVGVVKLGDSAVGVRMHVMVKPGSQWGAQRELYRRMKVGLDNAGIEIPFPQMVVHKAE